MSSLNTITFDKKETGNFTQVPNYLIDNKDNPGLNLPQLKPTARLLLINLLNKPKGWFISLKDLAQRICVGLQALNTARKALVLAGFIKVIRLKDKDSGLVLGTHYEASEKPIFYEENSKLDLKKGIYHVLYVTYETFINSAFLPCDGNPTHGHPSDSDPTTINTNYINTNYKNTEQTKKESTIKKTYENVKKKMSAVFDKNKISEKKGNNSSYPENKKPVKIEKPKEPELTEQEQELYNLIANIKIEGLGSEVIQEPVKPEKIIDLVKRFPERIKPQVQALPHRKISKSVAGVLINAIENNLEVPKIKISEELVKKELHQSTEKYLPVLKIWDKFSVYDSIDTNSAKTILNQKIINELRRYNANPNNYPEFFVKVSQTAKLINLEECFHEPSEKLLTDLNRIISLNQWA